MVALTEAFVPVRPDMDRFPGEFKRKMARINADAEGKKLGKRLGTSFSGQMGGFGQRAGGLLMKGFAALGAVKVFSGFINDARESERVSRLTAAAIKSTGGAAKLTADQVGKLSTAISNKTGKDDEAIQSGANLLLTFTSIRNQAGKNNDIFSQAASIVTDMTAAMNGGVVTQQNMKATSIQVGKALNDPTKGMTALSKVGVSFTDQQKKQIAQMQKSGNIMGAQKVILAELGKEFGGAAKASSDPMERLQVILGNVAENIGSKLLPTVDRFSNWLINDGLPAATKFFGWMSDNALPPIKDFAKFLRDEILPKAKEWGQVMAENLMPILERVGNFIRDHADYFKTFAVTLGIIIAAIKTWTIVQAALNLVLNANPIGIIAVALAALVAGLIYAYKHSDKFKQIVDSAFRIVKAAWEVLWAILKPGFDLFAWYLKFLWGQAQTMGKIMKAVWDGIKEPARAAMQFVIDKFLGFIDFILQGAAKAFGWVPKLGGPLKDAAQKFHDFRVQVNKELDGINDEPVNVKVDLKYASAIRAQTGGKGGHAPLTYARGGMMPGYTPGRDTHRFFSPTAGVLDLSGGEPVLRPEVGRVVGRGWVNGVNAAARMGGTAGVRRYLGAYAKGTPGLKLYPRFGNPAALADAAQHDVGYLGDRMASAIVKALLTAPNFGPPGRVRGFRGVRLNERTIRMVLGAERLLGHVFRIMQGSYSTSVAASGSTHAGGGAMDTNGPGGWGPAVAALRKVGFAAWHRTPAQGPWGHHIHSIAIGDPTASPAAKRQVQDFLRGGDGLGRRGGYARGGFITGPLSLDRGGFIPVGDSWVRNRTGRPEPAGHDLLRRRDLQGLRIDLVAEGIGTLTGHIRLVARDEIGASGEFGNTVRRMSR